MGIPGILMTNLSTASLLPHACAPPQNWSINQPSKPSSDHPRIAPSLPASKFLGNSAATSLGSRRSSHRRTRFNHDSRELRFVSTCSAVQESGTLRKTEEDDRPVQQSVATIHGEKEMKGEDTNDAPSPSRPKRIDFNYGFQAKFLRTGPTVPRNVFRLAFENFGREWRALRRSYLFREYNSIKLNQVKGGAVGLVGAYVGRGFLLFVRGLDKFLTLYDGLKVIQPVEQEANEEQQYLQEQLRKLVLSNEKVWERERSREAVEAPSWILGPYYFLCLMLDVIFNERPIQRFWFLETVARMPYFSYISMLHLYETLGWWRAGAEVRKVHFAEEWNEMHHLKIMEALGGDLEWGDRFFAQHAAFFYYWILNAMFLVSPTVAYNFSELIEMHAVDTYGEFADANEELLKTLPPPPVAVAYYESEDLYMYDEFQTSQLPESRDQR